MSAEMAHIPTGGHMPPPTPPERYTGHDACTCGHFKASHVPEAVTGASAVSHSGACYDPDQRCTCRRFDADLPWRTK